MTPQLKSKLYRAEYLRRHDKMERKLRKDFKKFCARWAHIGPREEAIMAHLEETNRLIEEAFILPDVRESLKSLLSDQTAPAPKSPGCTE